MGLIIGLGRNKGGALVKPIIVDTLPTASESTMNQVYLVPSASDTDMFDVFYTVESGGSYSWEQDGSVSREGFEIADNLTTNDATKALSAKQGKVLDGKVTALGQDLAERAMRDEDAVEGNVAEFDANGNPVDAGFKASRIHRDLGYNAAQQTITLTAGETGKYVKCATRSAVANPNFNISAPFNVGACSELLIKTGYNPSDANHASLDISVIAIYEEIERVRTVQKKDGNNQPLYYEVDEDGNPTSVETTTVTDFPVYIQETYTEHRYLPNNEDRFVAIPDSGYYVANIPQSCKCVVSYKPGVTDLTVIVVKHGALANLTSQIFGIYEHRVMVEALIQLAYRVEALEAGRDKLGFATAGSVDSIEYTRLLAPVILEGHGAPSASTAPDNWPAALPWDGIPVFVGQLYVDLDAASGGLYYAVGTTAVANWKNA